MALCEASTASRDARPSRRGCSASSSIEPALRTREHSEISIDTLHAVEPLRFDASGQWADPLDVWTEESDERLDAASLLPALKSALETLPPRQRQIVLLRDVEGLSHDEACDVLGISIGNQRILLHRGRTRLREILERHIQKD